MVVGTTPYQDRKEAYPLDKKTLRSIALRSFFMQAGRNSETDSSTGWTWAIAPGLKKIHTNEQDYATALGQNLEYNDPGTLFPTFVMGVSLALEAQKADPAIIRAVRTSAALAAMSLENALFNILLLPGLFSLLVSALSGTVVMAAVYAVIVFLLCVILRFSLVSYGYAKGSAAVEKLMAKEDALKHASRIAGIFMIGAIVVCTSIMPSGLSSSFTAHAYLDGAFPGLIGVVAVLLVYHLLVNKNWSLFRCALLLMVVGFIIGALL